MHLAWIADCPDRTMESVLVHETFNTVCELFPFSH
jgi:hypothetical protein